MVAGHLHEKNGYYYIILNLTDSAGKRKPKWISTGLTIKGNKKRAEQMLMKNGENMPMPRLVTMCYLQTSWNNGLRL